MSLSQIKVNNQVVTNVDTEPILNSDNLVYSDGVAEEFLITNLLTLSIQNRPITFNATLDGYYYEGELNINNYYKSTPLIKAVPNFKGIFTIVGSSNIDKIGFYDSDKQFISAIHTGWDTFDATIPSNAVYMRFTASAGSNGLIIIESKYNGLELLNKIIERNVFNYNDTIFGKSIRPGANGLIWDVDVNYRLAKFYL